MRKLFLTTLIVASTFIFSGCASIVSKSNWPFSVDSQPQGAAVSIANKKGVEIYKGRTPAAMKLKSGSGFFSKEQYIVTLTMPGYEERKINVECKLNGWYFGNILIGGLIGMLVVDPLTGAMYRLDQDYVSVALNKTDQSVSTNELKIITTDEVPAELKSKLIEIK